MHVNDAENIRMCAICKRVLDRRVNPFGVFVGYQHTAWDKKYAKHDPVPVPLSEEVNSRCDFCGMDYAWWGFPCKDFSVGTMNGDDYGSSGDWAACDDCKKLVEDDRVAELIDRCIDVKRAKLEVAAPREEYRVLFGKFWANKFGEAYRVTV